MAGRRRFPSVVVVADSNGHRSRCCEMSTPYSNGASGLAELRGDLPPPRSMGLSCRRDPVRRRRRLPHGGQAGVLVDGRVDKPITRVQPFAPRWRPGRLRSSAWPAAAAVPAPARSTPRAFGILQVGCRRNRHGWQFERAVITHASRLRSRNYGDSLQSGTFGSHRHGKRLFLRH